MSWRFFLEISESFESSRDLLLSTNGKLHVTEYPYPKIARICNVLFFLERFPSAFLLVNRIFASLLLCLIIKKKFYSSHETKLVRLKKKTLNHLF